MLIVTKVIVLKKLKAQRLYVKQLCTAAEVSLKTGVTPKTVGLWIRAGNWNAERDKVLQKVLTGDDPPVIPEIVVSDLLEYIRETTPHLAKRLQPIIKDYLNQLN
jgi:hypothetical protein